MNILIAGCGDIGMRLARRHCADGDTVVALTRDPKRQAALRQMGAGSLAIDLDHDFLPSTLPVPERVYLLVPPGGDGDTDPRLQRLLDWLDASGNPTALVYFSSTGVYGDCNSAWVDETRAINPQTLRARRRATAERLLQRWSAESSCHVAILRVAGIYGPGRLPLERLRRQEPVIRIEQAPYSNRIHADDLANAAWLAATDAYRTGIFNASDGHPTTMTDYFNRLADCFDLPRPPQISLAEAGQVLSTNMLSYLRESRRIDNTRLREVLEVKLQYPDISAGLAACRKVLSAEC